MEILLTLFTNNVVLLLAIVGVLAFLVSVITEVTKNVSILAKVPTDLQVIILSMVLCVVSYLSYVGYTATAVEWYYIAVCIVAGFIVAFVAMYGWDKLTTLYSRFKK